MLESPVQTESLTLPFPDGTFNCIEIDLPWPYDRSQKEGGKGFNGWGTVPEYRIMCPYKSLSMDEIFAFGQEIRRVATPWVHLWSWVTKDFLIDGSMPAILKAWGFLPKQMFTWRKTTHAGKPRIGGMGYWGRNNQEYLFFSVLTPTGTRPLNATREENYFEGPEDSEQIAAIERLMEEDPCVLGAKTKGPNGRYHSVKPDEAYELISRNSSGPRLSIFQTRKRPGFDYYFGNEMPE